MPQSKASALFGAQRGSDRDRIKFYDHILQRGGIGRGNRVDLGRGKEDQLPFSCQTALSSGLNEGLTLYEADSLRIVMPVRKNGDSVFAGIKQKAFKGTLKMVEVFEKRMHASSHG